MLDHCLTPIREHSTHLLAFKLIISKYHSNYYILGTKKDTILIDSVFLVQVLVWFKTFDTEPYIFYLWRLYNYPNSLGMICKG